MLGFEHNLLFRITATNIQLSTRASGCNFEKMKKKHDGLSALKKKMSESFRVSEPPHGKTSNLHMY